MSKIVLNNLSSLSNEQAAIALINVNNDTIEAAWDNTLSRDGTSPNQMLSSLDLNSNRIFNLPFPASSTEPLRKADFVSAGGVINVVGITGPVSTTNTALARWSGTAGAALLNSAITTDTTGNLFMPATTQINFNAGDVTIAHATDALSFNGATNGYSFDNKMTVGGLLTLSVGQIAFPASQVASANANTLDDYEEGTWTPVDASGASLTFGGGTAGSYTKIGNLVIATGQIVYPTTANGSSAIVGGL